MTQKSKKKKKKKKVIKLTLNFTAFQMYLHNV